MKVKGITIDLGVNTKPVTEGFQAVNRELNATDKTLRDINKGLKLDPKNAELLEQKTRYLTKAIDETNRKLEEENKILAELEKQDGGSGKYQQQIDALKREIVDTTNKQKAYQEELKNVGRETENVTQETKSFEDQMLNANIKTELLKAGVSLAAEAFKKLVGFIKEAITASAEYADNILTQSKVTGISTDALQEYAYMAELVDVNTETISGSMSRLTKNMYSAQQGSKSQTKAFKALGITVTDSNGELRDANDVFGEVIDALASMENETERDAVAMQIFGKSAKDLNPLIEAGGDAIADFRQEAYDMGYVLDNDTLQSLGEMDDNFQRLDNAITTVKNQIGAALAPIITDITEKFIEWAKSVDWELIREQANNLFTKLGEWFGVLVPIITDLAQVLLPVLGDVLSIVFDTISSIVEWLGKVWDYLEDIGVIDAFKEAFKKVGDVISGVVGWLKSAVDWFNQLIGKANEYEGVQRRVYTTYGGRSAAGHGGSFSGGFASGGYNLSTNVTINNYSQPVSSAMADSIIERVNAQLGAMLK